MIKSRCLKKKGEGARALNKTGLKSEQDYSLHINLNFLFDNLKI